MTTYKVGYFVGSLSSTSINRELSKALIRLAPEDLEFTEIPIGNLPLYSPDYDENFPPEASALKEAIAGSDAILFVTPEYNRSIPGALKNAIDWASRPWGQNSFDQMPAAVIGASVGQLGTAIGATEPARRAQLLQRPADDRTRGLHPILPGDLPRRGRGRRRVHQDLPRELHGPVPDVRHSGPHRHTSNVRFRVNSGTSADSFASCPVASREIAWNARSVFRNSGARDALAKAVV